VPLSVDPLRDKYLPSEEDFIKAIDKNFVDKEAMKALLNKYLLLFSGKLDPQGMKAPPFEIVLKPGVTSFKRHWARKTTPLHQEFVDEQIKMLIEEGIIHESHDNCSKCAFPIVVANNAKSGKLRLCIDYRELNIGTEDFTFPLPTIPDTIKRLHGKKFFASLDMKMGYHQLRLKPDSRQWTTFITRKGTYVWDFLPFGPKNRPMFFQRNMFIILEGLRTFICEVFIDDILIYADSEEELLANIETVLARLLDHRIRLRLSKCSFGPTEIEYLGHIINQKGIELSRTRAQAIIDLVTPSTRKHVRTFLGMTNQFRNFVYNYAIIAEPLTKLTSVSVAFEWLPVHDKAVADLKEAIVNRTTNTFIDYSLPLTLRVDSSEKGCGGVLIQHLEDVEQVIIFLSHVYSAAATKWSTIEQEAYAIVFCVLQLRNTILGHRFTLETDHRNLVWLYNADAPKLVRWKLRLQEFQFDIRHIPGRSNVIADALSRLNHMTNVEIMSSALLNKFHGTIVGHHGINKTVHMLRSAGHLWTNMTSDVRRFIAACPVCQKVRLGEANIIASHISRSVNQPYTELEIDWLGPFQPDIDNKSYILVVVDCFTRYCELIPVSNTSAISTAASLLQVFGRYGLPTTIRSDNGPPFDAKLLDQFLTLFRTSHEFGIPYCPQIQGIVERLNGEVMKHLSAILYDANVYSRWSQYLPLVQRIVNTSFHSAIGTSPHRLLFGDSIALDHIF